MRTVAWLRLLVPLASLQVRTPKANSRPMCPRSLSVCLSVCMYVYNFYFARVIVGRAKFSLPKLHLQHVRGPCWPRWLVHPAGYVRASCMDTRVPAARAIVWPARPADVSAVWSKFPLDGPISRVSMLKATVRTAIHHPVQLLRSRRRTADGRSHEALVHDVQSWVTKL